MAYLGFRPSEPQARRRLRSAAGLVRRSLLANIDYGLCCDRGCRAHRPGRAPAYHRRPRRVAPARERCRGARAPSSRPRQRWSGRPR